MKLFFLYNRATKGGGAVLKSTSSGGGSTQTSSSGGGDYIPLPEYEKDLRKEVDDELAELSTGSDS